MYNLLLSANSFKFVLLVVEAVNNIISLTTKIFISNLITILVYFGIFLILNIIVSVIYITSYEGVSVNTSQFTNYIIFKVLILTLRVEVFLLLYNLLYFVSIKKIFIQKNFHKEFDF